MAPARRPSNGRSPLVNQQRQITSFFTKSSSSPSLSPSPSILSSKQTPKSQPNPNSSTNSKRSPSPSPSPTTPSPLQSKLKKPLLVIGPSQSSPSTPDSAKKLYGKEVVDHRIKVYWPLDQSWYEGCVKSFDKISGKHLIQYDDADEELLDLTKEKIEWVEEVTRKFRRLRRVSIIEDDDETVANVEEAESGGDDDSDDEDWGNNAETETADDNLEGMDLDDEEDGDEIGSAKRKQGKKIESRKRKTSAGGKLGYSKKSKSAEDCKTSTSKVALDGRKSTKISLVGNGGKLLEFKDNGSK